MTRNTNTNKSTFHKELLTDYQQSLVDEDKRKIQYDRYFGTATKHYLPKDELHKVIQALNVEIFNKD